MELSICTGVKCLVERVSEDSVEGVADQDRVTSRPCHLTKTVSRDVLYTFFTSAKVVSPRVLQKPDNYSENTTLFGFESCKVRFIFQIYFVYQKGLVLSFLFSLIKIFQSLNCC